MDLRVFVRVWIVYKGGGGIGEGGGIGLFCMKVQHGVIDSNVFNCIILPSVNLFMLPI
jgi:hypothetical protein